MTQTLPPRLRGLTLTEALLFLGIAAIVIAAVFQAYNSTSNTQRMNQANTQLSTYIAGIKNLYENQTSYAGIAENIIIDAGIAPTAAIDGPSALEHPWGDPVTIAGAADTFTITFESIPQDACVTILSSGLINSGTVREISVGSTTFDRTTVPTPGDAQAACSPDPTNNDIAFTSR